MLPFLGKSPLTLATTGYGAVGLVLLAAAVPVFLLARCGFRFVRAMFERATRS